MLLEKLRSASGENWKASGSPEVRADDRTAPAGLLVPSLCPSHVSYKDFIPSRQMQTQAEPQAHGAKWAGKACAVQQPTQGRCRKDKAPGPVPKPLPARLGCCPGLQ